MAKKSKGKKKVARVMREFKQGKLRSGSKHGPKVTNPKQAVAIAMSEAGMAKKVHGSGPFSQKEIEQGFKAKPIEQAHDPIVDPAKPEIRGPGDTVQMHAEPEKFSEGTPIDTGPELPAPGPQVQVL